MRVRTQGDLGARVKSPAGLLAALLALLAVLVAALPALAAGADQENAARSHAEQMVWKRSKTEVNPGKAPLPEPGAGTVSASDGHLDRTMDIVPKAVFTTDWPSPPATLVPGRDLEIKVSVTGRLTQTTDDQGRVVQGFRVHDAIPLVNDRWPFSRPAVGVGQNCVTPFGQEPSCTEPSAASGTFTVGVPRISSLSSDEPQTFSFGIGALNCGPCYVRYEYVAKSTGQTPKPKPKPKTGRRKVRLALDYEMRERMRVGPKGLLRHFTTPGAVSPKRFSVVLIVRRKDRKTCKAGDTFFWKVNGRPFRATRIKGCRFHARLPEGKHVIRMAMKAKDGARGATRRKLIVQDWLIVGLGDSNGAGEGDPDVAAPPFPLPGTGTWGNRRCHRSAGSYQAQAARAIERGDRRTSVTFVHLACSGAATVGGVVGRYVGIEPRRPPLRPQVNEMDRLANGREIDAVLISTGVNDIGFGGLVVFCINNDACQNGTGFNPAKPDQTLAQRTEKVLKDLPRRFNILSRQLKRHGVPAKRARRVFITQYYDQTRDHNGATCDPLIGSNEAASVIGLLRTLNPIVFSLVPTGVFDRAEAAWARESVLLPLNTAVRAAAQKHGWRVVVGVQQRFARHGVCSSDPWIVSLTGSAVSQRDLNGTLHANRRGNQETTKLVVKLLRKELYPGGKTRPPR